MADQSSLINEHGADILIIVLVVASTLLSWLLVSIKKNVKNWEKRIEKLETIVCGIPGETLTGHENRITAIEVKCRERHE